VAVKITNNPISTSQGGPYAMNNHRSRRSRRVIARDSALTRIQAVPRRSEITNLRFASQTLVAIVVRAAAGPDNHPVVLSRNNS